jgi:hypothetical protein
MFQNVSKCFKMFQNVSKCFKMFQVQKLAAQMSAERAPHEEELEANKGQLEEERASDEKEKIARNAKLAELTSQIYALSTSPAT